MIYEAMRIPLTSSQNPGWDVFVMGWENIYQQSYIYVYICLCVDILYVNICLCTCVNIYPFTSVLLALDMNGIIDSGNRFVTSALFDRSRKHS